MSQPATRSDFLRSDDHFVDSGPAIRIDRYFDLDYRGSLHTHEFTELVMVTGGQGLHIADDQAWPIAAGDVFVITGHVQHTYRDLVQLDLINILFDPARLAWPEGDLRDLVGYRALFTLEPALRTARSFHNRLHLDGEHRREALEIVLAVEAELRSSAAGYRFAATAELMRLIVFLSRQYSRRYADAPAGPLALSRTLAFMDRHPDRPMTLDGLATMAGLSRRSFCRAFRRAMGTSPMDYLARQRISRAAELLRRTDAAVTEIAMACGFTDSNYFARQFRQIMGTTARSYREGRKE